VNALPSYDELRLLIDVRILKLDAVPRLPVLQR
jgi:hypothetical protein